MLGRQCVCLWPPGNGAPAQFGSNLCSQLAEDVFPPRSSEILLH